VVRDEDSARLCQAHGVVAIEKPDDGFRCTEVLDLPAHAPLPPDHPAVGVCIFNQYSRAWTPKTGDWWVALLQSMARAWPHVRLEGFCFHTNRQMDYDTTRALFVRAGLRAEAVRPPDPDFRKSITDLRGYRAIVSTRFHAVVAGSVLGIPSVAVAMDAYYLAKMRAALKHAPAPVSILNPRVDPPETALAGLAPQPRGP
jgi:hypothetical protein